MGEQTFTERLQQKLKNYRVVALLIVVGAVVVYLANVADALSRISNLLGVGASPRSGVDLLARAGYPREIGDFSPPRGKGLCARGADGSLSVHVGRRAAPPGDFGGCCVEVVSDNPVFVRQGEGLAVDLTLVTADRVDVKLEADDPLTGSRSTLWLVRNTLQAAGSSTVEGGLAWDATPGVTRVALSRLCIALYGEKGPTDNVLTVRSALLRP